MSHAASTLDLLERARESLLAAYAAEAAPARHVAARVAAQRAAAALVATGRSPRSRDARAGREEGRPQDVWVLTASVAPELAEWADFFATVTSRYAAPPPRRGPSPPRPGPRDGPGRIPVREADDLLRSAETFVDLVARRLGLPVPREVRGRLVPVRTA